MHELVQWNPFSELDNARRQMTALWNHESAATEMWAPPVDIFEDDHGYLFKAELPGVKKDDVHVQLENGTLTIAGERKAEAEQAIRRVHRVERAYGGFLRSFDLPTDIDDGRVEASFKDGILTVTVAKAEHAKPRKIDVRVA